jgi:REP element-mobilizing transposase RayT
MTLYKNKYRIETTRLKNWDYSSNGYYYITICTKNREHIFGKIAVETGFKPVSTPTKPVFKMIMILNEYGKIVEKCWYDLSEHYANLKLDEFVIMPNHIHGIVIIENNDILASVGVVETGLKPVSS